MCSDVTVACVLRSGGCYTPEYVERLRDGVAKHLAIPHRFVCLSDVDVPCERIPLVTEWRGWWSKLELFRPGLLKGQVLYFDLDTVIHGDITPLAVHPHKFTMLSDLLAPARLASGVLAWDGDYSHLFKLWHPRLEPRYRTASRWGDQGWIAEKLGCVPGRFQGQFPGMFASYKASTPQQKAAASVVCFHGQPRPHEVGWQV